jgi:hypothetical protein
MALHLGWIPNDPGLRPREFGVAAPNAPEPDPAKVAALRAAQHARGLWTGLLIVVGLFALMLFSLVGVITHAGWAWAVAAGVALCCWLPVGRLGWNRRKAATRLRKETTEQAVRHAAEVADYEQGKALWAKSEADRIAVAPRWLRVAAHEEIDRLDVFGGTADGRRNMLTGLGWSLLEQHVAVLVLDLSQDMVAGGLLAAARDAGISAQDYELPRDLAATPLLSGMNGDEVASLIVEVMHADDGNATAAGRATDLMILRKIAGVLGQHVTMARLHAALTALLGDGAGDALSRGERDALAGLFGDGFRREVTGNLVRLAAVVEPLRDLGSEAAAPPSARLTCLSVADGPRDVAADLTAALIVQWATRGVAANGEGFRPAVIVAGADEQATRHLARLTAVCERYDIPLVRTFARLTEESARHLDSRNTAFMRLATRPEALRAAEHIGLERRFVAGRFSHTRSVSRSRTKTTSESVTHTSGYTQGESHTHTTGTTTGQSYSEAEVPRHQAPQVNVHVEDHRPRDDQRGGDRDADRFDKGRPGGVRSDSPGDSRRGPSGAARGDERADRSVRDTAERGTGHRDGAGVRQAAQRRTADPRPSGHHGDRPSSGQGSSQSAKGRKPEFDVVKTRTWFAAQHESDATTKSWERSEEDSYTRTQSNSRTDGVSVGDQITYELTYDHRVAPEALMALSEDQMLAPHITESTPISGTGGAGKALPDSKIITLVVDPAVIGGDRVAPVRPDEIPAYEPPPPAIAAHTPDYQRPANL